MNHNFKNCQIVSLSNLPVLGLQDWSDRVSRALLEEWRLKGLFSDSDMLQAVLVHDKGGCIRIIRTAKVASIPSLMSRFPQAELFERALYEDSGIVPDGHTNLKSVRAKLQSSFCSIAGDEVHEVAVGPVHAGIIEPGHFRFQCYGENVMNLEIALGYQHRGIEAALAKGLNEKTSYLIENIAGDSCVANSCAYFHALEALSGIRIPERAQAIRVIGLELERLANHAGDLGALANDVAFLPTASFCGRLRGDYLNITAAICGSRFGKSFNTLGGVNFDLSSEQCKQLLADSERAFRDLSEAAELLFDTPSVLARFENTGKLSAKIATELGLVGPAARACGLGRDTRQQFPIGFYQKRRVSIESFGSADVFSRAYVRWLEIQSSMAILRDLFSALPEGRVTSRGELKLASDAMVVSMIEGWRGEICHIVVTDKAGGIKSYKIIDPSFHNWMGLSIALKDNQISDFPLCNKSFNLSYCGFDL